MPNCIKKRLDISTYFDSCVSWVGEWDVSSGVFSAWNVWQLKLTDKNITTVIRSLVYTSVGYSVCLSVRLICLSVYLYICLYVCMSVCLFVFCILLPYLQYLQSECPCRVGWSACISTKTCTNLHKVVGTVRTVSAEPGAVNWIINHLMIINRPINQFGYSFCNYFRWDSVY